VGYAVHGDHGSGQENDKRVPMVLWSAHIKAQQPVQPMRTVDILPTVLKAMGIAQDKPADGKAWPVVLR
jgi:arylsulfatase A-like enzyme